MIAAAARWHVRTVGLTGRAKTIKLSLELSVRGWSIKCEMALCERRRRSTGVMPTHVRTLQCLFAYFTCHLAFCNLQK